MFLVRRKENAQSVKHFLKYLFFFSTGLRWHWCEFWAANMISVPCSHPVHTLLTTIRTFWSFIKKEKKIKTMTNRRLSLFIFSIILRGFRQNHCSFMVLQFIFEHLSTQASALFQAHVLKGASAWRERVSLSVMPFSPSVSYERAAWVST